MREIGFSTGCLHQAGVSIDSAIDFYKSIGADAIELSFATPKELREWMPSLETGEKVGYFGFVSFHAPFKEAFYGNSSETSILLENLRKLYKMIPSCEGIAVHPDNVRDFKRLKNSGLPFLVENMDNRKNIGKFHEEFRKLNIYGLGYVLDLHHAYLIDPSMKLARELIDVMGEKLKYFHVSGSKKGRHVPLHVSDNRERIEEILREHPNNPIILEGEFDNEETVRKELEYARGI